MNVGGNMSESVIIEVAINGMTKPARNPHAPLTPEAILAAIDAASARTANG